MNKLFYFLFFMFFCTVLNAQHYTLEALQNKFKPELYAENVLLEFQKSIEYLEVQPDLYEYIPGEVIAWSVIDGRFLLESMFLVKNDTIKEIEAIPNDAAFLTKLNSYVPEKSRFIYNTDLWTLPVVKEKLADNSYLIKVNVKSFNPRPEEPSPDVLTFNLEYTTKDFLNFQLIKLKNADSEEWIEVDDY